MLGNVEIFIGTAWLLLASVLTENGDSQGVWEKNFLASGHFSIVDGELHVNNSEESATYLVGILEGRLHCSISEDVRKLIRLCVSGAPDVKQHVTLLNQRNRDLASQIIRNGVLDVDGVRRVVDIKPANDLLIPAIAYLITEDRRVFVHFYSSVAHWGYLEEIEKNGNTIWREEMQAKQQSFEGNHWHFGYMLPSSKQIGILSFTDQCVTVSVHTFKDGTVIDQVKFFYR